MACGRLRDHVCMPVRVPRATLKFLDEPLTALSPAPAWITHTAVTPEAAACKPPPWVSPRSAACPTVQQPAVDAVVPRRSAAQRLWC
jgi:hypothetical protein